MPPSVDSTYTENAVPCVTRSTPRKRNLASTKASNQAEELLRKKSRASSSLSETSPRRAETPRPMGQQLTQESQKNRCSPDTGEYTEADLPHRQRQEGFVAFGQTSDGFLNRRKLSNDGRRAGKDADHCVRSMILHSENLARSILAAYEKESDQLQRNNSMLITELTRLRAFHEAASVELPQLRAFHDSATAQLSQLRTSNGAAAAEIAALQSENAHLAKKETSTSSKLDDIRKKCAMNQAVHILPAFVMSKALMIRDEAELSSTARLEIDHLRCENAKMVNRLSEVEAEGRHQISTLQASLVAVSSDVTKLTSEKEELAREKDGVEVSATAAMNDLLGRLAIAKEEVEQVRSKTDTLLREKDEAAARATQTAALKLNEVEARNETLRREMQTAVEIAWREMLEMHSTLESTTATVRQLFYEKADVSREISSTKIEIARLQSEKAALVAEMDNATVTVAREFKKLSSRCEIAVDKLKTVRQATAMEKARLESELAARNSELEGLRKKSAEMEAHMANKDLRSAAEIENLRREKLSSHAREAALLEKIQSMKISPKARSEMHLAFLFNWGLLRPEEHNFTSQGCSQA